MDLPLQNGMVATLDPEDADLFAVRTTGYRKRVLKRPWPYWRAWFNRRYDFTGAWMVVREERHDWTKRPRILLHREVGLRLTNEDPQTVRVIPRDGNFLNCRRENLYVFQKGGRFQWRPSTPKGPVSTIVPLKSSNTP